MDYATKFIIIALGSVSFFLILTQSDLLRNLLDSILNIAEAILTPLSNLLGKLI